jgi:cytosine/adenosine deaminase-related metal-dependent hydrolase
MRRDELPEPQASNEPPRLIRAAAVVGFGSWGPDARPGALVVHGGKVVEAGPAEPLQRRHAVEPDRIEDHPDRVLLPGLINAHVHLELTGIGPQPYGEDFIIWVLQIRRVTAEWSTDDYVASARRGAAAARAAGTEAVGDIAGSDATAAVRPAGGLGGVSYLEMFGMGPPWDEAGRSRLADPGEADGFHPHAPYSAGPGLFEAASASGLPVSCHLAETRDEATFVAEGGGPFFELLQRLGKWSPEFASAYGQGLSPVRWMEPYLRQAPWLLAHCNYVEDDDLALLAETGASVAYCPVASDYFGHHPSGGGGGGGHRYRDMLDAGINVCLGTDSVLCQPPDEPQPLGILPQMRHLHRRDGTDPATLLRMATTNGRRALGLGEDVTRLASVPIDPDDATDPLTQALRRNDPATAIECNDEPLKPLEQDSI